MILWGVLWKIRFLGTRIPEKPIYRGELPKKGEAWTVSRLKGLGKKYGVVFLRDDDNLMHTMMLFLKSRHSEKVASSKSSCSVLWVTNYLYKGFLWYTIFLISNTFISDTRLKLTKNHANTTQHPEAELLLFEDYSNSSSTLSF